MTTWKHLAATAALAAAFAVLTAPSADARQAAGPVRIGMIRTLFRDTPEGVILTLTRPLRGLMEAQTGMQGEWKVVRDAATAAKQLASGQMQIAVLHSFEYGWARQANPKVRPLAVASRVSKDNRFAVVVRQDGPVKATDDLKGTRVAIPLGSKEPAVLFLEVKCCAACACEDHFKETVTALDPAEALGLVVGREAEAALVDKPALDAYLKAKPKYADVLKVLAVSEEFPTGVLVYQEGSLTEDSLRRFRDGLFGAATTAKGKELLKMMKLAGFDPVPANYDAEVEELLKAYPAPAAR